MEDTQITDKVVVILGNVGKLLYRSFIFYIICHLYHRLIGEDAVIITISFVGIFSIIWMTMKEFYFDMENHRKLTENPHSDIPTTNKTTSTNKEETNNTIIENTLGYIVEDEETNTTTITFKDNETIIAFLKEFLKDTEIIIDDKED